MAVRGFVTLLCILLIGLVQAEDVVTSPLPSTAETRMSTATEVVMSSTESPTTTRSVVTTEASTTMTTSTAKTTTLTPTTAHNTTNATTEPPTTTHHNTTNSTTEPPTTTHHNTTNSTTEAPTTTHTNATTGPTTAPTTPPPLPNPSVGNYSVYKSDNVSICLLANMGLQFSYKINESASFQTINLNPNATLVNGTCGSGGSDSSLLLKSEEITVQFVFINASQKFHLHSLTFSVDFGNGSSFNASNSNLSLWEASLGSSYMCKKEQSFNITDNLALHTFELRVQPFDVKKNLFSTAHECSMDDTSLLIPIIVGAALAGLIVIVVIAYMIGRRRTYVGYQTL